MRYISVRSWPSQLVLWLNLLSAPVQIMLLLISVMSCDAGCNQSQIWLIYVTMFVAVCGPLPGAFIAWREGSRRGRTWVLALAVLPILATAGLLAWMYNLIAAAQGT